MKILLISEFFPTGTNLKFSGGVEARNFYVAKNLSRNNEVTVLTSAVGDSLQRERIGRVSVVRVGPRRSYQATSGDLIDRIKFTLSAIKAGRNIPTQIVDGSNFITHFIAKRISQKNKVPSVAWYPDVWIGSWIKNAGIVGVLGEILERTNLKLGFDSYIAISKSTADKLQLYVDKRITVIHCGADLTEFKSKEGKYSRPTIICVSRLAKYKNVKDLILAFAYLKTKLKAGLIIVGSGPEKKSLENLAGKLNLKDEISFYSNLPRAQLVTLIKKSHMFSLPSSVEGFGIATIEAAAAGLPYVVSDIDVFREITQNGRGGFLFKTGNINNLAQNLEKLITDKKLYDLKSKEAIALAKSYDWGKISYETEKLYREVIKRHE